MKNILLAFDGSSQSYEAATICWHWAERGLVNLTAQHVVNTRGLWQFLDFHTPGLTGSGPFIAAQTAISKELRILAETLATAYNAKAQGAGVESECFIDEGSAREEILKRSMDNDLIVVGYRVPSFDMDDEDGCSFERFMPPSLAEALSIYCQRPLLVVQDKVPQWSRIDLQVDAQTVDPEIVRWAARLADFLKLDLEIHGYVIGDGPLEDVTDFDEITTELRAELPMLKIINRKIRYWRETEAGSVASVACPAGSLVIVPTSGLGPQRKTPFGGSPDNFLRYCDRHSLLLLPAEFVRAGVAPKMLNLAP